jgi:hypothetical protein
MDPDIVHIAFFTLPAFSVIAKALKAVRQAGMAGV